MKTPFIPALHPPADIDEPGIWYVHCRNNLLIVKGEESDNIPLLRNPAEIGLEPVRFHYLGRLGEQHCYTAELDGEVEAPDGMAFVGLRKLFGRLDDDIFGTAMRTVQIVAWDRDNQFCGRCGNIMELREYERAKFCPNCGLTRYPRISPAIIVAVVKDGDKLMMARNHRYPAGWYSVLAGFVEPGETLEDTVAREVREEVGIEVSDISYFGSQPWPFPDSLMVAFTAAYAGGDIVIEEEELEDARWFTLAEMPDLIPSKMSISRRLIDWFVESQQRELHL